MTPPVPPRPSRPGLEEPKQQIPQVPPRPSAASRPNPPEIHEVPPSDQSVLPVSAHYEPREGGGVSLPSNAGEQGVGHNHYNSGEESARPPHTMSVSADVPLQQPTASHPQSTAKSRIAGVTRTDSAQAAAAGIGRSRPEDDSNETGGHEADPHPLQPRQSVDRPNYDHHEGIPEIGQQIPLFPNAGDVQAPSPGRQPGSRPNPYTSDSYGIRGRGSAKQNRFEKDWIAKHPEEAAKERSPYLLRPESAMSSEQLNKLVSESSEYGTESSRQALGTPEPEVAFEAHDIYAKRLGSPIPPQNRLSLQKQPSSGHEPSMVSPLRRHESTQDEVIHIDPHFRGNKVTGGGAVDGKTDVEGDHTEHGEEPILASDEVVKRPHSAFMAPAVEPDEPHDHVTPLNRSGSARANSRSSSRASNRQHRISSNDDHPDTHLQEIEEYEPLFADDEKPRGSTAVAKPAYHRFPSKDVWEDAPESLKDQATVSTPEPPRPETDAQPGTELGRMQPNRPVFQRFPSRDIWEDTPESMHLETTVSKPQMEQTSPEDSTPPQTSSSAQKAEGDGSTMPARPVKEEPIQEKGIEKSKPVVPGRPKPTVPTRPSRPSHSDGIGAPLAKTTSAASTGASSAVSGSSVKSPPVPVPGVKPTVPPRPAGGKIAALQSSFMNDLNNRLKLGPQAPPPKAKEEVNPDTASAVSQEPLADARKGRARGPAKRSTATKATVAEPTLAMSGPVTVWEIVDDELRVPPIQTSKVASKEFEESATGTTSTERQASKQSESATHGQATGKPSVEESHGHDVPGADSDILPAETSKGAKPSVLPKNEAILPSESSEPAMPSKGEESMLPGETVPVTAEEARGTDE
ncbi:hypothetical protein K470DRAFT_277040 [Piedraia hortae CBS 480.64]|uniref:Altered inheritance of mitochondria protein 21 n=1 Tax=Piedraia hortae CBS 480.64 TaxID=1314780 RepID=A0A6A7BYK7_9PEZI|nr:hypothetical protein K470DRAFT_277040 [Piedraia hortae CBS 480.64]